MSVSRRSARTKDRRVRDGSSRARKAPKRTILAGNSTRAAMTRTGIAERRIHTRGGRALRSVVSGARLDRRRGSSTITRVIRLAGRSRARVRVRALVTAGKFSRTIMDLKRSDTSIIMGTRRLASTGHTRVRSVIAEGSSMGPRGVMVAPVRR